MNIKSTIELVLAIMVSHKVLTLQEAGDTLTALEGQFGEDSIDGYGIELLSSLISSALESREKSK